MGKKSKKKRFKKEAKINRKEEVPQRKSAYQKLFLMKWRPYVWLIGIGFAIYCQVVSFMYVGFDDEIILKDNLPFIKNLSNVLYLFTEDVFHGFVEKGHFYRPILTLSFILNAQFGTTAPWVFYLGNIVTHLVAACLLFIFLYKLIERREIAFAFSMLFVIHPVLTQAVAWIPGRNDSLLTLFVLLSFICFIQFMEKKGVYFLLGTALSFAAALFTKETAIMVPILMLFYVYLLRRETCTPQKTLVALTLWSGISIFWFILRQKALITSSVNITIPLIIRALGPLCMIGIQSLGKIILPVNLSTLATVKDTPLIFGTVSLMLIVFALIFSKEKRYKHIVFGCSWFVLFLWPASISHLFLAAPVSLEHRIYLPMIGLLLVFFEIDFIKKINVQRIENILLISLVLVGFAIITLYHETHFKTPARFWQNAVQTSPNSPLAHFFMGNFLENANRFEEAEKAYQKAMGLKPDFLRVSESLARLYSKQGKTQKAEQIWKILTEADAGLMVPHYGLGLIYLKRGDFQEAEKELTKAVSINPNYDESLFNLGMTYYHQGKMTKAEKFWKRTLETNPNHIGALSRLGAYYYNQGNFSVAKPYFEQLRTLGIPIDPRILKK